MKYALLLVVVVMLVRIDVVWDLVQKVNSKIPTKRETIESTDLPQTSEVIPLNDDKALKQKPKDRVIGLMDLFHQRPDQDMKANLLSEFQKFPNTFTDVLDPELEGAIYQWRELIQQNNLLAMELLSDLIPLLQGQNQVMARKFFSLVLDQNAVTFVKLYGKTKDLTCQGASFFADELALEEQFAEYKERETTLTAASVNEALDASTRGFALICLGVVKKEIERLLPLVPKPEPEEGTFSEPIP